MTMVSSIVRPMVKSLLGSVAGLSEGITPFLKSFSGASAAYSLRQLSSASTDVVRVRRSSDDAEQDFSASEVSGGAVLNWVNTEINQYTSDFATSVAEWTGLRVAASSVVDPDTGSGMVLRGEVTADGSCALILDLTSLTLEIGAEYDISADIYIPSTNTTLSGANIADGFNNAGTWIGGEGIAQDTWVTLSGIETPDGTTLRIQLDGDTDGTISTLPSSAIGDLIYVKNVVVNQTKANGFTTVWYDQRVPTSTDRMYFDGVDDKVDMGSFSLTGNQPFEMEATLIPSALTGGRFISGSIANRFEFSVTNSGAVEVGVGNSAYATGPDFISVDEIQHIKVVYDGTNSEIFVNDVSIDDRAFTYSGFTVNLAIGYRRSTSANYFNGTIYDVILSKSSVPTHQWNGYGNTNADWLDQVGSNNGTVVGSPARYNPDTGAISNDAVQTTAANQPKIVDAGVLVTENSKPAIKFEASPNYLDFTSPVLAQPFEIFTVSRYPVLDASFRYILDSSGAAAPRVIIGATSSNTHRTFAGTLLEGTAYSTDLILRTDIFNGASSKLRVDGVDANSGDAGTAGLDGRVYRIGSDVTTTSYPWKGSVSEVIIFGGDQSANRADIEANINTAWSVY